MCWMAAIPLAMSAVGALQSSQAAGKTAAATQLSEEQQAQVQSNNATIATWDASDAITAGAQKAQQSQLSTGTLLSTQRATMAANGVDLTQGSAANVQASTKYQGETDVNTINANAARTAWGYANQAQTDTNNSETLRAAASQISPAQATQTSLLGGASQVAGSWYGLNKQGAFS
jgi:hypothetical protein